MVATRTGDSFAIAPRSQDLLAKVNTAALEYAPAISTDGLELYFTRASGLGTGHAEDVRLRIMVARRRLADVPFDAPRVLDRLTGYVEAPSLSRDCSEMFFHKKVAGQFVIYRAVRTPGRKPRRPPTGRRARRRAAAHRRILGGSSVQVRAGLPAPERQGSEE